jgi:hypothetical protein
MADPRKRAGGRGPRAPPTGPERERLAQERRDRAHEELLEVRVDPRAPFLLLRVGNPLHESEYRVYLPAGTNPEAESACDCTDFAHRGLGTCKHLEAARLWLAEHPLPEPKGDPGATEFAGGVWREIDRRQAARPEDPRPASQSWRRPGAVLFELARPPNY